MASDLSTVLSCWPSDSATLGSSSPHAHRAHRSAPHGPRSQLTQCLPHTTRCLTRKKKCSLPPFLSPHPDAIPPVASPLRRSHPCRSADRRSRLRSRSRRGCAAERRPRPLPHTRLRCRCWSPRHRRREMPRLRPLRLDCRRAPPLPAAFAPPLPLPGSSDPVLCRASARGPARPNPSGVPRASERAMTAGPTSSGAAQSQASRQPPRATWRRNPGAGDPATGARDASGASRAR